MVLRYLPDDSVLMNDSVDFFVKAYIQILYGICKDRTIAGMYSVERYVPLSYTHASSTIVHTEDEQV